MLCVLLRSVFAEAGTQQSARETVCVHNPGPAITYKTQTLVSHADCMLNTGPVFRLARSVPGRMCTACLQDGLKGKVMGNTFFASLAKSERIRLSYTSSRLAWRKHLRARKETTCVLFSKGDKILTLAKFIPREKLKNCNMHYVNELFLLILSFYTQSEW